MGDAELHHGDCLEALSQVQPGSVDLVYADPPFFTQRRHKLTNRAGTQTFSFEDCWKDQGDYADFLFQRLSRARDCLRSTGSLFLHCDRAASHIARLVLDQVFGPEMFQSEIIWHFKRWSNSKKGLLPAHQTIFWYSKTKAFKFFPNFQDYSPTTNIDQIMQRRTRDARNKSVYAKDESGRVLTGGAKKGVPLSDVWEIPFLNPKAKERVGYPTQKPFLLINRIVELVTEQDDLVLDPFCGSGTTLVSAQLLGRRSIGIDTSEDALSLTRDRLSNPIMTKSALLRKGKAAYQQHNESIAVYLTGVPYTPVQRNRGIDGLLKEEINGHPVFVRVQRPEETLHQAASALLKSTRTKGPCIPLVIATRDDLLADGNLGNVRVVPSIALLIHKEISQHLEAAE